MRHGSIFLEQPSSPPPLFFPPNSYPFCMPSLSILQCIQALQSWAKSRPSVIGGSESPDAKKRRPHQKICIAKRHWNRKLGVQRPRKAISMHYDVLVPLLESLNFANPLDHRDMLLFNLAIISATRAKEASNMTWKDVTVLHGGDAIKLDIRPSKNTTKLRSTHSAQFGRRTWVEVGSLMLPARFSAGVQIAVVTLVVECVVYDTYYVTSFQSISILPINVSLLIRYVLWKKCSRWGFGRVYSTKIGVSKLSALIGTLSRVSEMGNFIHSNRLVNLALGQGNIYVMDAIVE